MMSVTVRHILRSAGVSEGRLSKVGWRRDDGMSRRHVADVVDPGSVMSGHLPGRVPRDLEFSHQPNRDSINIFPAGMACLIIHISMNQRRCLELTLVRACASGF